MNILALDLSLTHTGWAFSFNGKVMTGSVVPKEKGHQRLERITANVLEFAKQADIVVLEGPSFGSKGRALFDIAGLRAVVTHTLWKHGIEYVEIPPSSLKKFAAHNGNASKDAMIAAAIRSFDFPGSDNNEADAWCLLHVALEHYIDGSTLQYRRDAIAAVDWPVIA
jgi:Holliday junction resolvasome RuvABC endonuclease subunit